MPYIITTRRTAAYAGPDGKLASASRRAVATLEEARQRVFEIAEDAYGVGRNVEAQVTACRSLTESGGAIDTLPNGTVIEVARVNVWRLAEDANVHAPLTESERLHEIIDAYNARADA